MITYRLWDATAREFIGENHPYFNIMRITPLGDVEIFDDETWEWTKAGNRISVEWGFLLGEKCFYEGDIIRFHTEKHPRMEEVRVVEWSGEGKFLPFNSRDYDEDPRRDCMKLETVEVIGDIHNNPELLEEK